MTPDDVMQASLYSSDNFRSVILAFGRAERQRAIDVIESHRVPVGNGRYGEELAEMTMDALREVRDAIRSLPDEPEMSAREQGE